MADNKDIASFLKNIVPYKGRVKGKLEDAKDKDKIPGGKGIGKKTAGGSVVSPLTELENRREYYTNEKFVESSDGLFVMVYKNISSSAFLDGNGSEFIINWVDE